MVDLVKLHYPEYNPADVQIIALCGYMRSGKDTVALYMEDSFGYVQYAFANPLKEVCKIVFGFTDAQVFGSAKDIVDPRFNVTPRVFLQNVGTELFRDILPKYIPTAGGPDVWVVAFVRWLRNRVLSDKKKHGPKHVTKVVISDMRFLNEGGAIRDGLNGTLIRVKRDSVEPKDISTIHKSEQEIALIPVHKTFENNSTFDDLFQLVKSHCAAA
jgi:hypothetical protein